jgi:endonuclease/exonuclease/phosphatase (EEP) superfamily protein YafD
MHAMTRLLRILRRIPNLLDGLITFYVVGLAAYLILRLLLGDRLWWLALLNNFTIYYFVPLLVCLPLATLMRRWWTLARLIPFLLIALLWYAPYYLPKAQAALDTPSFKVVTFNVLPSNRQLSNLEAWLREIEADLVLLQEIPDEFSDADNFAELRDLYPYQVAQQPDFSVPGTSVQGVMVLSRYPFLTTGNFDLGSDSQGHFQQRVTLEIGGRAIALYNIHMLMPIRETPRLRLPRGFGKLEFALKYDDSTRNAHITRLLEILQEETLPYIVAGDFNLSDQSATYNTLSAVMGDSFREAGVGFGASWPAGESEELPDVFPPLLRVDYLWHSREFRALEAAVGPKLGSDHLPLYGTFSFQPAASGD